MRQIVTNILRPTKWRRKTCHQKMHPLYCQQGGDEEHCCNQKMHPFDCQPRSDIQIRYGSCNLITKKENLRVHLSCASFVMLSLLLVYCLPVPASKCTHQPPAPNLAMVLGRKPTPPFGRITRSNYGTAWTHCWYTSSGGSCT